MITPEGVQGRLHVVRGQRAILDSDLARIYGVATKQVNQAVRRNGERFPSEFCFQLTRQEVACLKSQIVTSKPGRGGVRKRPWVFTEHGALMAATVLNSPTAIRMSLVLVRAFVELRRFALAHRAPAGGGPLRSLAARCFAD